MVETRPYRARNAAGVNIVGMQVFPGIASVTDELVVEAPAGWDLAALRALAASAGADFIDAHPCRDGVLLDQATRHVEASRTILDDPARFPEVVAQLLDAEPEPIDGSSFDSMDLMVGDVWCRSTALHRSPRPSTPAG